MQSKHTDLDRGGLAPPRLALAYLKAGKDFISFIGAYPPGSNLSELLEAWNVNCVGPFADRNISVALFDKPTTTQVGGEHYKKKAIQPLEYIHKNGLGFCEGNVVKYITRWRDKNGIEDLKKVKHYVDLLIELEGLDE